MQAAFYQYDRDRSGFLTADELYQGLSYAGYRFDQPSFAALLRTFDPDRNGRFSLPEFMAMCVFLTCANNTFRAFDPAGTGRISADFNQFLYAACACR